ncbi:MAG: ArsR family transcriptional regulator [Candidatus Eremiobacteraeota bacterium]|nr:ArsR family transcriptional regulator [Candidatus Eremiobacteraeota bacterium]
MTRRSSRRRHADPDVAAVAALIGDRTRAAMLFALLDGRELPATELAFRAGTSAPAASSHLAQLVSGGLLAVTASGRQRLFRLASPDVAHAIEALAVVARPEPVVALSQSVKMSRLREARSCYDHLAGRMGVALTDALLARKALRLCDNEFEVTRSGEAFFTGLEIDLDAARGRRRSFAPACVDWTERRPHLAGSLGASILQLFLASRWITRNSEDRALRVTPEGRVELEHRFRIRL